MHCVVFWNLLDVVCFKFPVWGDLIYMDWHKLGATSTKIDPVCISSDLQSRGNGEVLQSHFAARAVEMQRLITMEAICCKVHVAGVCVEIES